MESINKIYEEKYSGMILKDKSKNLINYDECIEEKEGYIIFVMEFANLGVFFFFIIIMNLRL
jgi:hypothetical protein